MTLPSPLAPNAKLPAILMTTRYWRARQGQEPRDYAYLEDVHPDGRITYVTEGELRALTRTVSSEEPPYRVFGPYHTFKTADGAPIVPGEVAEFKIGLQPTSVLFKKGHRIRLALAGHDGGLFARIPKIGDPVISVERNADFASFLELPVVK